MKKLRNKVFRDAYLAEHVRTWIAYQVTALRHQRGLTQADLAELTGKQQSVISRIEDPDYGPVKLSVLLSIASALDIALAVKFVPFSEAVAADLSSEKMHVSSFDEEFAHSKNRANFHFTPASTARAVQHSFLVDVNVPVMDINRLGRWAHTPRAVLHWGGHGTFTPALDMVVSNAPYSQEFMHSDLSSSSLRVTDFAGALTLVNSEIDSVRGQDLISNEGVQNDNPQIESV